MFGILFLYRVQGVIKDDPPQNLDFPLHLLYSLSFQYKPLLPSSLDRTTPMPRNNIVEINIDGDILVTFYHPYFCVCGKPLRTKRTLVRHVTGDESRSQDPCSNVVTPLRAQLSLGEGIHHNLSDRYIARIASSADAAVPSSVGPPSTHSIGSPSTHSIASLSQSTIVDSLPQPDAVGDHPSPFSLSLVSVTPEPYCEDRAEERYEIMLTYLKALTNQVGRMETNVLEIQDQVFDVQNQVANLHSHYRVPNGPSTTVERGIVWQQYNREVFGSQPSQLSTIPRPHHISDHVPGSH